MATPFAAITANLSSEVIQQYTVRGPRYTSYPTAPVWEDDFASVQYHQALQRSQRQSIDDPYSLYVHVPFCEERCLYCSCNIIVTQQRQLAETYLDYLFKEIDLVAPSIDRNRVCNQIHWGGGTPTYLSVQQIERLITFLKSRFNVSSDAEIAIEIDPRVTTHEQLVSLRNHGFNRVSFGVQDFDAQVQETVNRVQPFEMTQTMMDDCRQLGFSSINIDLIYGLPYQTAQSFAQTIEQVLQLLPDRIALYNYAHVPWLSPHQKAMPEDALPSAQEKLAIFKYALQHLTQEAYHYIGLDHFALPKDELSLALVDGTLYRNFMGYTVHKANRPFVETDMVSFGVSAISYVAGCHVQNHKKLPAYYAAIDVGEYPVNRGFMLSQDDLMRRFIILDVLCKGHVDFTAYESQYQLTFAEIFAVSLQKLAPLAEHGLVVLSATGLQVTSLGRLFARNIAMAFDAYLDPDSPLMNKLQAAQPVFSSTL